MLLGGYINCKIKGCKSSEYKQAVYKYWHNVDCFNSISFGEWHVTWIRNWWVCRAHTKGDFRFHDIDGIQWILFSRRGK